MLPSSPDPQLIEHLVRHSGLSSSQAIRLINEIVAFYSETPQLYIRRRHSELQKSGLANELIYSIIAEELGQHRFASEPLTTRQIRRAIYG
ncbi:MAG: hypothetical protein AB8B87_17240 [Granulosicoccus sp.]